MADPKMSDAHTNSVERQMADKISSAFACSLRRLGGDMARVDYEIVLYDNAGSDQVWAYAELKRRYNRSTTYYTVFLAEGKYQSMLALKRRTGLDCFFIVQFDDMMMMIEVDDIDASKTRIAGRTDRVGVSTDQESIIDVPIKKMMVLVPEPLSH